MRIEFEPEGHIYRLDGEQVLSVTQVTDELLDFSRIPREVLERARVLGGDVHKAISLDICGELDDDSLDSIVRMRVNAWRAFVAQTSFEAEVSELIVGSAKHRYAGTLDIVGLLTRKRVQIDVKSGEVPNTVGLQTAAYEQAYHETVGDKCAARYALQLRADGSFRLQPCSDPSDFNVFLSQLNVRRWKQRAA